MLFLSFPGAYVPKPRRPQKLRQATGQKVAKRAAVAIVESIEPRVETRLAFDAEAAFARAEGDPRLLRKMVGLFANHWRKHWTEIAKAGQQRDGATLEMSAHQLQRSLASFGAVAALRAAGHLKGCGRNRDFSDLEKRCTTLQTEIEQVVHDLVSFADQLHEQLTGKADRSGG